MLINKPSRYFFKDIRVPNELSIAPNTTSYDDNRSNNNNQKEEKKHKM